MGKKWGNGTMEQRDDEQWVMGRSPVQCSTLYRAPGRGEIQRAFGTSSVDCYLVRRLAIVMVLPTELYE